MLTPSDEDRIEELLDRWEAAFEQGRDLSTTDLCQECPELAGAVEARLNRLRRMNGLLEDEDATCVGEDVAQGVKPVDNVDVQARFRIGEFIDKGGLGSVFSCYDEVLKRDSAIKLLSVLHAQNERSVRQFRTECEITSRLDHPGIVSIYGHGTLDNGQPFYVMQRVSGQTLRERIDLLHKRLRPNEPTSEQRIEFHSLLSKFIAVCQTIHYAHCRGVIHRDIKPNNIMVGKHGETTLLDWGLATLVGRAEPHQNTSEDTLQVTVDSKALESSAGTPMYMAPEQHAGGNVDALSDVYALGATLYVILTGNAPYDAGSSLATLRTKVLRGDTVNPKDKYRWMPRDLVAICRKAMMVDPETRYRTALELAQDVERYLADEPVQAVKESALRRTGRWMARHRLRTLGIATALAAALLGTFLFFSLAARYAIMEGRALVHAKDVRSQSLKLAAGFASQSLALRMNDRWRILEIVTRDNELIEALKRIDESPEDTDWLALQAILLRTKEEYQHAAGEPTSWFICDANGRQVARIPENSKTIGGDYSHRDYFHGQGLESPAATEDGPVHITQVHRSKVYDSTSEPGKLKVALSCPIWSQTVVTPDREFLGIIGMSVSLGEFAELEHGMDSDQRILVVDLEENEITVTPDEKAADSEMTATKEVVRGLVLHHPFSLQGDKTVQALLPAATRKELFEFDDGMREVGTQNDRSATILRNYTDPLKTRNEERWIAAYAPVMVKTATGDVPSGWGVIVAERALEDPSFFGKYVAKLSKKAEPQEAAE